MVSAPRPVVARYRGEGRAGLVDRSSAPRRVPRRTAAERRGDRSLRRLRMQQRRSPRSCGCRSRCLGGLAADRLANAPAGAVEPPNRYEADGPASSSTSTSRSCSIHSARHRLPGRGPGRFEGAATVRPRRVDATAVSPTSKAHRRARHHRDLSAPRTRGFTAQGVRVERVMTTTAPPTARTYTRSPAAGSASDTAASNPADPAPTAKPSASSRPALRLGLRTPLRHQHRTSPSPTDWLNHYNYLRPHASSANSSGSRLKGRRRNRSSSPVLRRSSRWRMA